jgi:peptide/nickel transport system permease protein
MITIPPLLILVVFQAAFGDVTLTMMAVLIAGFVWQSPTRLIRAQVLSMRESGYVQMARLSGAPTMHIMFREMLPNLAPYLFGSFIANVTTAIVTAVGLEVLGLGPQRIPTLGRTIYEAINAGALIQNLWWWWGIPTLLLALMFVGLLLINLGLDEVSNPSWMVRCQRSSRSLGNPGPVNQPWAVSCWASILPQRGGFCSKARTSIV